jgi:hypothetical protein
MFILLNFLRNLIIESISLRKAIWLKITKLKIFSLISMYIFLIGKLFFLINEKIGNFFVFYLIISDVIIYIQRLQNS